MSQDVSNGLALAYKPPYFSYITLKNYLDSFKSSVDVPSHIERGAMPPTMSGGNQVAVINALKFLGLISDNSEPQESFYKLVESEGKARQELMREVVQRGYAFLLNHVDIERTISSKVVDRFKDTGMSGDTIRKAIQFFQGAAKDVGMKVSPHIKAAHTQSARPKAIRMRKGGIRGAEALPDDEGEDASVDFIPVVEKTPYQVLIEILSPQMEETEQDAVWTLIRYLKKQEAKA